MKIAILSRDAQLYSCCRLRQAAEKRGHTVEIIDPLACHVLLDGVHSAIYCGTRRLDYYDAVIPRIGSQYSQYALVILRQFELLGCAVLNNAQSITLARDKLRSLQQLAAAGIAIPKTGYSHPIDGTETINEALGGAPVILKLLEGTQGIGVVLAETPAALDSTIDAFRALRASFIQQAFIREAAGRDIRCLVVGDRVVAAMERCAKKGEFRSNLHRGGEALSIDISEQEQHMAIHATHALGLSVAGVDILRAEEGPLVMEVNASPGLEGIEQCSRIDIAVILIKALERQFKHQVAMVS